MILFGENIQLFGGRVAWLLFENDYNFWGHSVVCTLWQNPPTNFDTGHAHCPYLSSWQCQDFKTACPCNPSLKAACLAVRFQAQNRRVVYTRVENTCLPDLEKIETSNINLTTFLDSSFTMIEKCPWMGHLHLFGKRNVIPANQGRQKQDFNVEFRTRLKI